MTPKSVCVLFSVLLILGVFDAFAQEPEEDESVMEAVEERNVRELNELIEKGADVNFLDEKEAVTPLILASMFGYPEIVKILLEAGAEVNMTDASNDATPLMWASMVDPGKEGRERGIPIPSPDVKLEIVQMLLQAGADTNVRNAWGGTAAQWAADEGNVDILKALIRAGADVNIADNDGLTPLMAAVNYDTPQHSQCSEILLKAGAAVDAKNASGDIALFYAMNNFKTDNTILLLKSGANVNHKNREGYTALMKASQLSRTEIMKVLLEAGADLNAKTAGGLSVLSVAKKAGYKPAIQLLLEAGAKE